MVEMAELKVSVPEMHKARDLAEQALAWTGDADIELEAALKCDISPAEFAQVVAAVTSFPGASSPVQTVQLDIMGTNRRWEFVGEERIRAFLRRGNSVGPAADRVLAKKVVGTMVKFTEFPIVLRLKSETTLPSKGALVPNTEHSMRLKRRMSVSFESDGVRVDMTAVMSGVGDIRRVRTHEIEIEALPPKKGATRTSDELAKIVFGYAHACLCALRGTSAPVSETDIAKIMTSYDSVVGTRDSRSRDRFSLVGPQPVTLTPANLQRPGPGIVSVMEGYTVTDKADGERRLLFVADGSAVLIDSRKNIVRAYVDVPKHLDGTVIDGELVTKAKVSGTEMRLFAAFDAYWVSGRSVSSLPLMSPSGNKSRLSAAAGVLKALELCTPVDGIKSTVKDFALLGDRYSERVAEAFKKADDLPYSIDGLIFTPANGAVGAMHDNDEARMTGRWPRALKWKPPSHNSIDFLVRIKRDKTTGGEVLAQRQVTLPSGATVTVKSRVVQLCAGYDPAKWDPVDPVDYLTRGQAAMPRKGYVAKVFAFPGYGAEVSECVLDVVEGRMLTADGEALEDNSIAEFSVHDGAWKPMRVRHDKNENYVKTDSLSGNVNDWGTALSVFSTIINPVSKEMLLGDVPPPAVVEDSDVYYTGEERSTDLAAMRDFHNLVVKDGLYDKYGVKEGSLLEFACGKGGDLNRWLKCKPSLIVGVDKSHDNIVNPGNGLYARWDKTTARMSSKPRGAFITMDATTRMFAPHDELKTAAAESGETELVNALWALPGQVLPALEPFKGAMTRPFDLVSCQFSVHYMFETSETLDRFIANVARLTKSGGHFIGTTFDGDRVAAAMGSKGTLSGRVGGRDMWSISMAAGAERKRFAGETGVGIDVFVGSIGKPAREYLVSFKTFASRMERAGFALAESESFKDVYARAVASKKLPTPMASVEKELSFLNRTFAFKKK